MKWDNVDHYFSGQGIVLTGKRDANGDPMGLTPVGNVSDLKITVSTSVQEHKESKSGQRSIDKRTTTETKCALSMTMENFIASNLADVLRGDVTTVAAGTETDYPIKAYLGKVIPLPHINISTVVLKSDDGVTTYAEGTDYFVNPEAGSIKLAAAITGVVEAEPLKVTYAYDDQVMVDALTGAAEELFLRFEGLNTADNNESVVVEVFKIETDPLKELALISDNIQQFVLEGNVLSDATKTVGSKYFRVLKTN